MAQRVLATARNVRMVLDEFRPRLESAGVEVFFPETADPTLTEAQLLDLLPGCVAAVAMPDDYSARVIEASAPPLKLIARSGVGYDFDRRPGGEGARGVGHHHHRLQPRRRGRLHPGPDPRPGPPHHRDQQQDQGGWWGRLAGMELRGKTLGIVGTGRIGREVAARAAPFGMRLVAYDLYPDAGWAAGAGVEYLPLPALLEQADVVTLHAPSTAETRHLLNRETLGRLKRGACVVNTARGELIDEGALLAALQSGQVGGAGLDVFASEPPTPAERPLIEHPNVIATAHCAGAAVEAQRRAAGMALEEVLRVVAGERPRFPVAEMA